MPAEPARALLIVHGVREHSGCYEPLARWFARRCCAVFAFDQRGHGRSGGARVHARHFSDYLEDLAEVMGPVREECPDRPLYLLGHDLGALVSALFVQERAPDVAGALLSATPLTKPVGAATLRATCANLLAAVAPRWRLRAGRRGEDPTAAPDCFEDPLVERGGITASLRAQFLRATARLRAGALNRPVLLLQGERDPRCDPSAGQRFAQQAPQGQLRTYPGLTQGILQAPSRERVFSDMLAWLHEREENPA